MKLLYVTWDGPRSNYLEGLFFPIFEQLVPRGVQTHVMQFSWDVASFEQTTKRSAELRGIGYSAHPVPRRPLLAATGVAITLGAATVVRVARRLGTDVLMPRSHIPAAIALASKGFLPGTRLIWDSDGLMPDERADFGGWSRTSPVYRAFSLIERAAVRQSEHVLTRTHRAAALLGERAKAPMNRFITVANGKDTTEFSPGDASARAAVRHELGVSETAPLLTHVGSLGPQYHPSEMLRVFASIRERLPAARLLLLTGLPGLAKDQVARARIEASAVIIRSVAPTAVASILRACDAGFALRRPSLSQQAVSPIKVAEYLLCGVPVLANKGVGDLDVQLADEAAASLIADLEESSLKRLADDFVKRLWPQRERSRQRCRALGERWFSLESCVDGYARALGLENGS